MCNYRTLYYDDKNGYIIICEQCQYLQLGFGCVLVNFRREEFNSFRKIISEVAGSFENMPLSAIKSVTIPTPCEGLLLYLSTIEVSVLHKMIEEADTSLCVEGMLSLFNA